ncbi:MAG: class I SAM-dependent methyltransferase [Bacteroidota bacterium]|nr:class I SAM-dependent methyltransferase [Bacteroidota bacterium]
MALTYEQIEQDWEIYWGAQGKPTSKTYDLIAEFYRRNIIIKILNHFLKKHYKEHENVLHAGCGSGQVDLDANIYLNITALDISSKALEIYKKVNPSNKKTVKGTIFDLPFEDNSFDGIYNLGVMEHFTEEEIQLILKEFKRVVKKEGKIILFWPPTRGITVNFLDSVHFICNKIFQMNVKLHPDEITRIRSKKHAQEIIEKSGMNLIDYYFGIKDIFTQAVIVAQKK